MSIERIDASSGSLASSSWMILWTSCWSCPKSSRIERSAAWTIFSCARREVQREGDVVGSDEVEDRPSPCAGSYSAPRLTSIRNERRGDVPCEGRSGRDAEGRRHHGRRQRRAGEDRRGRRCRRGHGARARSRRHPPRRRRRAHVRSDHDQGHPGGRDDPGHGQGAHRPLRRGAGARGARGRLHRRVRGPDARRRGQPHRQVGLQGPVRVRRDQPRRGAAPDRRGRGDDPLQGRGRHRRHRRGRPPPAHDPRRDPPAADARRHGARDRGQGAAGAAGPRAPASPRPASCRSCCSARAGSPRRPTRRS